MGNCNDLCGYTARLGRNLEGSIFEAPSLRIGAPCGMEGRVEGVARIGAAKPGTGTEYFAVEYSF